LSEAKSGASVSTKSVSGFAPLNPGYDARTRSPEREFQAISHRALLRWRYTNLPINKQRAVHRDIFAVLSGRVFVTVWECGVWRDGTAQSWRMSYLVAYVRQTATITRLEEECQQVDRGMQLLLAEMQEATAEDCRRGRLRERFMELLEQRGEIARKALLKPASKPSELPALISRR